ncbi:hypothetical protein ROD_35261 [Citrobacter rodentium ICC168]|uniref:Uncharacterized protein n=1 Tax=Citrobacter rodentium (strain ICC168) TaxID=637910 RepID=D2TQV3_CITRI|nr:hypothetical protein ROD_35261 [Citrobacter rodentium ICC168]
MTLFASFYVMHVQLHSIMSWEKVSRDAPVPSKTGKTKLSGSTIVKAGLFCGGGCYYSIQIHPLLSFFFNAATNISGFELYSGSFCDYSFALT